MFELALLPNWKKKRDISDIGCFRPSIVSVCTFHADHFGIDDIYLYISFVTNLAKYQDISDYGFFRPFIVSESTFHADHFGIDGI